MWLTNVPIMDVLRSAGARPHAIAGVYKHPAPNGANDQTT